MSVLRRSGRLRGARRVRGQGIPTFCQASCGAADSNSVVWRGPESLLPPKSFQVTPGLLVRGQTLKNKVLAYEEPPSAKRSRTRAALLSMAHSSRLSAPLQTLPFCLTITGPSHVPSSVFRLVSCYLLSSNIY